MSSFRRFCEGFVFFFAPGAGWLNGKGHDEDLFQRKEPPWDEAQRELGNILISCCFLHDFIIFGLLGIFCVLNAVKNVIAEQ